MRSWRSPWQERLRRIIVVAQKKCEKPNSAREVVRRLSFGRLRKLIESDESIRLNVLSLGLAHEVREFLKDGNVAVNRDSDDDMESLRGISVAQLELWPDALQPVIGNIRRSRVYVPSVGEHVDLAPDKITRAQAMEAGRYLIKLGHETTNEGQLLVQLSATKYEKWQ